MDDEARQLEVRALHDEGFNAPRRQIGSLKRKTSGVSDQLANIRAQLAARQELASSELHQRLPAVNSSVKTLPVAIETSRSVDRLRLPLLHRMERMKEVQKPPKDSFLEVHNVLQRAISQEIYVNEVEKVTTSEKTLASTLKEAEEFGEEARKRMVAYSQNESGWKFEERTVRYQQVMEMKQKADKSQQEADIKQELVVEMKKLLRDPYKALRAEDLNRKMLLSAPSALDELFSRRKEYAWVWIIAAPSTKLSFTPREETVKSVMEGDKELSMYIIYYIAGSSVNNFSGLTAEQWRGALNNDCPPTTGWICSSMNSVLPAPELRDVKSGMQTWTMTGAGVGHLNGKYVLCGVHDRVRKFKSSAGVELFRKCLPVESSIVQTLYDGDTTQPEVTVASNSEEELRGKERATEDNMAYSKKEPGIKLPSGISTLENNEHDFRSMQRLGSWLSVNESTEKYRRRIASRSTRDDASSPGNCVRDGDNVMNQGSREPDCTGEIAHSRPQASAPLCREWVLFARCSRRTGNQKGSTVEPSKKGIGCLKRHHYVSHEEETAMTIWVQTKESWLEKNALAAIIEREAQVDRVQHLCRECMVRFQQNLRKDTERTKRKILVALNRVRFLTVKVFEAIDRWRQHARKVGFARYDNQAKHVAWSAKDAASKSSQNQESEFQQIEVPSLGWSSSITLETGKQLYKGSKAFVSKVKRFRRSEDNTGKKELHTIYLGYFPTQDEAERAYDVYAASEARRLNTTVEHLPRRRNVFRSCGKHFAIESEKAGPSFCIECKTTLLASKSAASPDEWIPPFFYGTGANYAMKMANDLDFLDDVLPLKAALNDGRGCANEVFPMRGNVFLLPRTPIQDPDLAVFTTFQSNTAPRLGESPDESRYGDINDEALDRERIFKAQVIFLQELQIYRPELFARPESTPNSLRKSEFTNKAKVNSRVQQFRLVEALYWDHCAALKMLQQRPPLPLRQPNVWCRPDEGEWSSLVVRGAHQLHFQFEEKLEQTGKEMLQRRQQVLSQLRQINKIPLYLVSNRTKFTELIAAGQQVRGDVVHLEVNNTIKQLQRYDAWCAMSLVVQRWFRGVLGRHKARMTRKALRLACKLRVFYFQQVAVAAKKFFDEEVHALAVRRSYKKIIKPAYTRAVSMDGELAIVTFHSLRHYQLYHGIAHDVVLPKRLMVSPCCRSCARQFDVKAHYQFRERRFGVYRGVCACSFNGGSNEKNATNTESWLIRAYSPSHNTIYRLRLETPQLQQLLSSQKTPRLQILPKIPVTNSLILEMESQQLTAAIASRHATYIAQRAAIAANNVANWRRMNSEATQTRKSLLIHLETNLSLLDSTKHAHSVSIINAAKALDFASRPFSESQAWDPLENANDWRFIVQKRQLGKRSEEMQQKVERLRVALFQASYNEHYTRAGAKEAQNKYNRTWLPLVDHENKILESTSVLEATAKTRMEQSMSLLCERYLALRESYLLPTRRHLFVQSPMWHGMLPFRINIPGLRRRLNHIRRRILMLSNRTKKEEKTRKLIVSVSMWSLVSRSHSDAHQSRDMWVTAYDPVDCSTRDIFLEWDLVELLTGTKGRKICHDPCRSKRSAWQATADIVLSLVMLDRFTGEFTLEKLQFFHTMRRLKAQFLSSRVMRDLEKGRKSGQGDEILRQGVCVDGRLCVVVVYENWGDLSFAIYHTSRGQFFRLMIPLAEILDILGRKPLMLRLWISSVKSNSYSPTLLVYILKHVRFRKSEDGYDDVYVEHVLPAQQRFKRYQAAIRIQTRQLLVSITEDCAGDFYISGYDMNSDLTYKLLLERDNLHRMLRMSTTTLDYAAGEICNDTASSSSSLLLRRNRSLLYEWICSRLRFQSLLEHPDKLMSGTSPLFFGLHLRESFQILNRWITSSPRNPLRAVSEVEIDHRASEIDAAAFSCLQFDQLVLMTHQRLPFDLEKQYVGTIDWMDAVAGSSQSHNHQEWKKALPHMRLDFFVKSHNLFARLRGELGEETKQRRQREEWAGMEQEDRNSLCIDIAALITPPKELTTRLWQKLADLRITVAKRTDQWQQIFAELRAVFNIHVATNGHIFVPSEVVCAAQMLQEDSMGAFMAFLASWACNTTVGADWCELISAVIPFSTRIPLAVGATIIQACLERLGRELKAPLCDLERRFVKLTQDDNGLEYLRAYKLHVMHFCNNLAHPPAEVVMHRDATSDTGKIADVDRKNAHIKDSTSKPAERLAPIMADTAILIPTHASESIQEIFLTEMPAWAPTSASPYVAHKQDLIRQVRPLFQQLWKQQQQHRPQFTSVGSKILVCHRVPYGVLVFKAFEHDPGKHFQEWNPRAAAITVGLHIGGPALFCPISCCGSENWYERIVECSAAYMDLISASTAAEPEDIFLKRSTATRSNKFLPWKQFAVERLRISHAVKQSRMTEGVCRDIMKDDTDKAEKDCRTFSSICIGFRQLETLLGIPGGNAFVGNENTLQDMMHLFALHRISIRNRSESASAMWQVSLSNPRVMHHVLDDVTGPNGEPIQVPCIGRDGDDVFQMQGIQVEIDDVDKPRRLIYSCRELQSQRKYFVDYDYYQLQTLLLYQVQNQDSPNLKSTPLEEEWRQWALTSTIQDWRKLAALAARFLVFRKKNGTLSMCLEVHSSESQAQEQEDTRSNLLTEVTKTIGTSSEGIEVWSTTDEGNDLAKRTRQQTFEKDSEKTELTNLQIGPVVHGIPTQQRRRAVELENYQSLYRCVQQRFQQHQPAIRAAVCGRILSRTSYPSDLGSRRATEWIGMTQEDWCAQELRGILVLDTDELLKLENAYAGATRRAQHYMKTATNDTGGLKLQLKALAKSMGQSALQPSDSDTLQSIRALRWRRRGKEASQIAKREEAKLTDVAEWWRRRLIALQAEKNEIKATPAS